MKKTLATILALAMSAASIAAFAEAEHDIMLISQQEVSGKVTMSGTFKELTEGQLLINEGLEAFAINTDENTVFLGENGEEIKAEDIKEESILMVVSDEAQTRSIPPQSYGYIVAVASERVMPVWAEVAAIEDGENGEIVIKDNAGNYNIYVTEETEGFEAVENISEGAQVIAYSEIMTMSIPAIVPAEKIVVLEETEEEIPVSYDKLFVNGEEIAEKIENDGTSFPLRAICEKIGYEVSWDGGLRAITVGTVPMGVNFNIGVNSYNKAKMMPATLSEAPIIINDRTYVPEDFFTEMLGAQIDTTNGFINIIASCN